MPRVIFHIDMDAFFASVEQRDFPQYQGLPVIVGAPPNQRGVVCAASYEARAFKVHSAMPSRTAAKLCPHGVFLPPRMQVYRSESAAIMQILGEYTQLIEPISVDEAYLDLSSRFHHSLDTDLCLEKAIEWAEEIKQRIQKERQLTASIGIAGNKFLAKLGSDFNKPNGLTLIKDAEKVEFLKPLSIRRIHGVGKVTAETLENHGIKTIEDLQQHTIPLTKLVGSSAQRLYELSYGIDQRPVVPFEERKSISAESTFLQDTEDRQQLRQTLKELASEVAAELLRHKLAALTLQVKVRYSDFTTLTRQIKLNEACQSSDEIYRQACHILAKHQLVKAPLRLLGIGTSNLVQPKNNSQLFFDL